MTQPERLRLANLPTPLVPLERLGHELGGAQIWVKRDDLTGLELSGNKIRKLEYIAADALAQGCDMLVTEGTPQSNHCRATAAVCARLGLGCLLLLRPEAPDEPEGNHLLDVLFGAQTRSYDAGVFAENRDAIVAEVLEELRSAGRRGRWTPMGASEALGCWGYLAGAAELAEQLCARGVETCDVVVAISSGGTYGGLLLGQQLYRLGHWGLWAVPVSDDSAYHRRSVRALVEAAIERYGLPTAVPEDALRLVDGYVGEGYAVPYAAALEAIRLVARCEGIVLDPVYTGKAFCALLDGVRERRWGFDRPVVFVHTGGAFSNFAWGETLLRAGSQR
jgi:D-cysteine desulfhydrase